MEVSVEYILKSNLTLLVIFCFYKLCLERYNQLHWNRIYLITGTLIAVFVPLLTFQQPLPTHAKVYKEPIRIIENLKEIYPFSYNVLAIAYWIIVLILTIKLVIGFTKALKIKDFTNKNIAPHVFLNQIFIPIDSDPEDIIYEHEKAHATQWHSLDVLFFEIINLFFWYNPFIYWLKLAAKNNHEYLADRQASKKLGDKKAYAQQLVSTYFQVKHSALTHSFYQKAGIKQRLSVLAKPSQYPLGGLIFAVSFILMAILSSFLPQKKQLEIVYHIKISNKNKIAKTTLNQDFAGYKVLIYSNKLNAIQNNGILYQKAKFDGGQKAFQQYFNEHLNCPKTIFNNTYNKPMYLNLTIEPNGKISHIYYWSAVTKDMKKALEKMFNGCSEWIPEYKNGKFVSSKQNICIEIQP